MLTRMIIFGHCGIFHCGMSISIHLLPLVASISFGNPHNGRTPRVALMFSLNLNLTLRTFLSVTAKKRIKKSLRNTDAHITGSTDPTGVNTEDPFVNDPKVAKQQQQ